MFYIKNIKVTVNQIHCHVVAACNVTCYIVVITLYMQDRDWTQEERSVVTTVLSKAKIREIGIAPGGSRSNWRTLSDALVCNDHVREVILTDVPDDLKEDIRRKLDTVELKFLF